jgi:di/tricarboxylate transporter
LEFGVWFVDLRWGLGKNIFLWIALGGGCVFHGMILSYLLMKKVQKRGKKKYEDSKKILESQIEAVSIE